MSERCDVEDEAWDIFPLGSQPAASKESSSEAPSYVGTGVDFLGRPDDKCPICHELRILSPEEAGMAAARVQAIGIQKGQPIPMRDATGRVATCFQNHWEPPFHSASAWISSSLSGCKWCRVVISSLAAFNPFWFDEFSETSAGFGMGHKFINALNQAGAPLMVSAIDTRQRVVGVGHYQVLQVMVPLQVYKSAFPEPYYPTIPAASPVSTTNRGPDAIAKAKRWIETCKGTHKNCRAESGTAAAAAGSDVYFPSKILDIGTPVNVPLDAVRLVEGTDICGPWAALSYCWGPGADANIRTLKENLEQHRQAISTRFLPAGVRDAIEMARSLGFCFLWIDALCIVQDDDADWSAQVQKMGLVYFHADLVIQNETADDCRQPLHTQHLLRMGNLCTTFAMRDFDFENVSFRTMLANAKVTRIQGLSLAEDIEPDAIHVRLGSGLLHAHVGAWNQALIFPLRSRGWTLQEGFLATRLLRLTRFEMSWRCMETSFCECQEASNEYKHRVDAVERVFKVLNLQELHISQLSEDGPMRLFDGDEAAFLHFYWTQLVKDYSARLISNPHDRLAAIHGLTGIFLMSFENLGIPSGYLAGHWVHGLLESLLWLFDGHRGVKAQFNIATDNTPGGLVSFDSVSSSLAAQNDHSPLSMYHGRNFKEGVRSGKPVQSLEYTDLLRLIPGVLAGQLFPSWSWSSLPFAVDWPPEAQHCDPVNADAMQTRFFPSARITDFQTVPAPGDTKQRIVHGYLGLSGTMYPVQARSMPMTTHGSGTTERIQGTFLSIDFILATTGSAGVHQIRFPNDCTILFSPDLPCLYGDNVTDDYWSWSPALADSLREDEERAVAAIHRHTPTSEVPNLPPRRQRQNQTQPQTHGEPPGTPAQPTPPGMADRFPCWDRPRPTSDFQPKISPEYKGAVNALLFSRSLCSSRDCACRQGWTSPTTHPLWAMKVGTYRMERNSGRALLKDYFLVLAESPFTPGFYVRIGLATTQRWGDHPGCWQPYGEGKEITVAIE